MTPQTLQKDLESSLLNSKLVTLIIIDEAHRTTGNYAYNKIIELLEEQGSAFRVVSLSATPVSKIENLQTIVDNLRCCRFEVRDETDAEVKKYTYDKNIKEVYVEKDDTI